MSDLVTVPFGDNASDKAVLLLAEVEKQGLDPSVVRTDSQGASQVFVAPKSVADKALSGDDAVGVEDYEDPWENIRSGEMVSGYPQVGAEAKIGQPDKDSDEPYADRLKKDLEAEVKTRQDAGREIKVGGSGNKADLVAALEADDAKGADQSPAAPESSEQPTQEQAEEANPEAAQPEKSEN